MKIHTSRLDSSAIYAATSELGLTVDALLITGSRSRRIAFDVRLYGHGYRRNTGQYGATWDEWGAFLGRLYLIDPDMVVGSSEKHAIYADRADFNDTLADRFADGEIPEDTHKRHVWRYVPGYGQACKCCSAEINRQHAESSGFIAAPATR